MMKFALKHTPAGGKNSWSFWIPRDICVLTILSEYATQSFTDLARQLSLVDLFQSE